MKNKTYRISAIQPILALMTVIADSEEEALAKAARGECIEFTKVPEHTYGRPHTYTVDEYPVEEDDEPDEEWVTFQSIADNYRRLLHLEDQRRLELRKISHELFDAETAFVRALKEEIASSDAYACPKCGKSMSVHRFYDGVLDDYVYKMCCSVCDYIDKDSTSLQEVDTLHKFQRTRATEAIEREQRKAIEESRRRLQDDGM